MSEAYGTTPMAATWSDAWVTLLIVGFAALVMIGSL
jgi:hypothetical protein